MVTESCCKHCGEHFISKFRNAFCSYECKSNYYREYNKKRAKTIELTKTCSYCNTTFTTYYSKKKFCSSDCKWLSERNRLKPTSSDFRIFRRDNFTCVYCGKSSLTDNVKLHVDHIYPSQKGGDDSDFNLITSCEKCNISKTDTLLPEEIILKLWRKNIKNKSSFEELKNKI